jgi:DNA-binding response OmpR family regulator
MNRQYTVLVVEDDQTLLLGLEENLTAAGYRVLTAADGAAGLKLARERRLDLMILDLMLPRLNGFEVCKALRAEGMRFPILLLTARQEEIDKLMGFEMGADDYVTKPFSVRELLARIKAMLAREERTEPLKEKYRFDDFLLDTAAHTLTRKEREIPLTRTEFDLLAYFLAHAGQALSRDQLLKDVWGTENYGTQRSLDTFVAILRGKIEKAPQTPRHIVTVHRVGYKFMT